MVPAFFYHQYHYAGPYDAILRREYFSSEEVLKRLKRWRYHTEVWFEIVPDALTTVFKRLGMGGWTETGHRACAQGCVYWTETWSDGFYSIDLELERLHLDSRIQLFDTPRYLDVETWGSVRRKLQSLGELPQIGQQVEICGPLRVDRPYFVFTLQPDRAEDYKVLGSCKTVSKNPEKSLQQIQNLSCEQIQALTLFKQIALLDSLIYAKSREPYAQAIEKMIACVHPEVLQALSTNGDAYQALLDLAPEVQPRLPPLADNPHEREGSPVSNTIRDLLKNWFHFPS